MRYLLTMALVMWTSVAAGQPLQGRTRQSDTGTLTTDFSDGSSLIARWNGMAWDYEIREAQPVLSPQRNLVPVPRGQLPMPNAGFTNVPRAPKAAPLTPEQQGARDVMMAAREDARRIWAHRHGIRYRGR